MVVEGIEETLPKILKAMKEDKAKNKLVESKNNREENYSSNGDNSDSDNEETSKKRKRKKGCTFRAFQGCKPLEYAGNEGAFVALRWLEKTEYVISISKCADKDMVLYASNLFKDEALEWWNSIIQAMGRHKAYAMEWENFKEMLKISVIWSRSLCLRLAPAVQLGGILTDGMIRKQEEGKARELAKRATENQRNNFPWKKRNQPAKGGFNSSIPECKICKKRHT
ncbi:hypothetical protein L1987_20894 [Smallanthus sonchifolius]|uniref:Uncharacterized protein n=1 Tax=Smallanthus sonchifolius TaxID=185202 RepID=A0ACB9ITM2_9ASTR|nr:hypothetical protein L1987_20894 [Smallanthus sonchifolius]